MPISDGKLDFDDSIGFCNWYLDNADKYLKPEVVDEYGDVKLTVYCEPFGVYVVIISWNFPLGNFVWAMMQPLITGNTVVLKHSEECLLSAKLIVDVFQLCQKAFWRQFMAKGLSS